MINCCGSPVQLLQIWSELLPIYHSIKYLCSGYKSWDLFSFCWNSKSVKFPLEFIIVKRLTVWCFLITKSLVNCTIIKWILHAYQRLTVWFLSRILLILFSRFRCSAMCTFYSFSSWLVKYILMIHQVLYHWLSASNLASTMCTWRSIGIVHKENTHFSAIYVILFSRRYWFHICEHWNSGFSWELVLLSSSSSRSFSWSCDNTISLNIDNWLIDRRYSIISEILVIVFISCNMVRSSLPLWSEYCPFMWVFRNYSCISVCITILSQFRMWSTWRLIQAYISW